MLVKIPENQEIERGIQDLSQQALSLIVKDDESYKLAGEILNLHKKMEKEIKDFFAPHKSNAHKAWKELCNAENDEIEKLKPGINYLGKQMTQYYLEQERIRKEEEEKLRKEALKKEEEERLKAAIEAEKEGMNEIAEEILKEPVSVPPPIVDIKAPKISGLSVASTWQHRVVNLKALVKAVAEGKIPIIAIKANDVYLGQQARSTKGTLQIPGVEFYEEKNVRGVRQ